MAAGPTANEDEEIEDVEDRDEVAEVEAEVGEAAEVTEPVAVVNESLFPAGTWAREPERIELEPEPEPELQPEPEPQPELEPEPQPRAEAEPRPESAPRTTSKRWFYAAGVVVVAIGVVVFLQSGPDPSPPHVESRPEPEPPVESRPEPAPPLLPAPAAPSPPSPAQPPPDSPTTGEPSRLRVTEAGIGDRDRFAPGERVRFTTRVVGGRAGEDVSHVWMRDGKVEQTIRLRLGGSSWRTYSTKTVGRPGAWVVEARDDEGRVLAREAFTCR